MLSRNGFGLCISPVQGIDHLAYHSFHELGDLARREDGELLAGLFASLEATRLVLAEEGGKWPIFSRIGAVTNDIG